MCPIPNKEKKLVSDWNPVHELSCFPNFYKDYSNLL